MSGSALFISQESLNELLYVTEAESKENRAMSPSPVLGHPQTVPVRSRRAKT